MKDLKQRKSVMAVGMLLVMLIFGSCLVSYKVFDTGNPLSAAVGFGQIMLTDKPYVTLSSKVMLSQLDNRLLTDYMENRGFKELEAEQLGAMRVFSNGEHKEYVMYSQNAHFSKWSWK